MKNSVAPWTRKKGSAHRPRRPAEAVTGLRGNVEKLLVNLLPASRKTAHCGDLLREVRVFLEAPKNRPNSKALTCFSFRS